VETTPWRTVQRAALPPSILFWFVISEEGDSGSAVADVTSTAAATGAVR
jgi:hypothetical protein